MMIAYSLTQSNLTMASYNPGELTENGLVDLQPNYSFLTLHSLIHHKYTQEARRTCVRVDNISILLLSKLNIATVLI